MIKIDDLVKLIVEIYKNSDLKITISSIIMSIVLFLIYLFYKRYRNKIRKRTLRGNRKT